MAAEKRMFSLKIIDSDTFLDMSHGAQSLYFHLSARADDEGFVNNTKKIMRMVNSCDDDLKILIAKQFIIPFESGAIVIKHWKIHNCLRPDRMHATFCKKEREMLDVIDNVYEMGIIGINCPTIDGQMTDKCQTIDGQMPQNVSIDLGLDLDLDLVKKNKGKKTSAYAVDFNQLISDYTPDSELQNALKAFVNHRANMKPSKKFTSEEQFIIFLEGISALKNKTASIKKAIANGWQGVFESNETAQPQQSSNIFTTIGKNEGLFE